MKNTQSTNFSVVHNSDYEWPNTQINRLSRKERKYLKYGIQTNKVLCNDCGRFVRKLKNRKCHACSQKYYLAMQEEIRKEKEKERIKINIEYGVIYINEPIRRYNNVKIMRSKGIRVNYNPRCNPDKIGFVYVITDGQTYKIGYTFSSVYSRLIGMSGLHNKVILSIETIYPYWLEQFLHKRFSKCLVGGEWYNLGGEELKYIHNIKSVNGTAVKIDFNQYSAYDLQQQNSNLQ